jgi:phosphoadenosine phosphosulfate reductase
MRVTMVKKQLASGEPCRKCAQAEELLKNRGLWDRIGEVVWAIEGDLQSPGMRLATKHRVDLAPFFVLTDDSGNERVQTSALLLVRELTANANAARASSETSTPHSPLDIERVAAENARMHPRDILAWGLRRYGRDCTIAFSGAEDVVLIQFAVELGLPFSVFTLDTGRLHPETYRFIDKVRKHYAIEIDVVSPDAPTLEAFVRRKGLFSFYEDGHKECCGIRKVQPLRRTLARYAAWVTGQRMDQSPATRSDIAVVEPDGVFSNASGPLVKLNPLTHWSGSQVWAYIQDRKVPFNALHERGFVSIGCEPCTRATLPGEHERAGRWWWEEETKRECGLHVDAAERPEP